MALAHEFFSVDLQLPFLDLLWRMIPLSRGWNVSDQSNVQM